MHCYSFFAGSFAKFSGFFKILQLAFALGLLPLADT